MKIMRAEPNESGAFPPIQEGNFAECPEGCVIVPDTLDVSAFYSNGGFVTIKVNKAGTITSMTADSAAWTKWQTDHPAPEEPAADTSDAEIINTILGVSK